MERSGPLSGVRVLEFAGIGPGPYCGQLLSDAGATVLRIDRPGSAPNTAAKITQRGRRIIRLDLKSDAGREIALDLVGHADILIEGFRPGVMERLGLGPDQALARNPRLVFGRMTGWGQSGPLAHAAGHDINYLSLSGALHAIGTPNQPIIPLNIVGDFGGGALFLAFGVMAALVHARESGRGQVVDAAISDGTASLMSYIYGFLAEGSWFNARAANRLDGGAHFYNVYQCADGKWISVAAYEPQFYQLLRDKLGLLDACFDARMDREAWPVLSQRLEVIFRQKTSDDWRGLLEGTDVCFAPVLDLVEAPQHAHNVARETFVEFDGVVQPAPAPRFSATPGRIGGSCAENDVPATTALAAWGLDARKIEQWRQSGAC
jgi:alpha-methylacyl-CoA racemase